MALTDVSIKNAKPRAKPYKLGDAGGLFLLVQPSGGKLWRLKYRVDGREKKLAIGTYPEVSLAEARKRRDDARELLAAGKDPSREKQRDKVRTCLQADNTFTAIAREFCDKRTRILDDGGVAKVFEQTLFWRATVDDRMADNIYFDAREAMEAVNAWETGGGKLTFHPVDRRWLGDDRKGYYRSSQLGEVKVIQSLCGSWKIDRVPERCFREAKTAQRYADERLP